MKIEETKCDYCGKTHATPGRGLGLINQSMFLFDVPIDMQGSNHRKYRDFCNEDCLLEFLVKRKKEAENKLQESLKNPDPFACVLPPPQRQPQVP